MFRYADNKARLMGCRIASAILLPAPEAMLKAKGCLA